MSLVLKRLEMKGFKSFAKRTVFEFNVSVTAVVGPNGSGKSNVVEAIRFVLGEQSSKSLRSKSGADLIFKGSRMIPKMNRASATIVFDNTARSFQLPSLSGIISLDFDEISITREVFTDGTNNYHINGSQVRLKDVHELIASVHIGSSGHHIISQGEADRLLNAKPAERREILEEALGLRLYHYRITDAEKKLEKTRDHMREVELLRRELAPQVKFLKKQVERVEQVESMRNELAKLYETYLVDEESFITYKMNNTSVEITDLESKQLTLQTLISQMAKNPHEETLKHFQEKIGTLHARKKQSEHTESELTRAIGRIEGTVEALSRVIPDVSSEHDTIPQPIVQEYIQKIDQDIAHALLQTTISEVYTILGKIREYTGLFSNQHTKTSSATSLDHHKELEQLRAELQGLEEKLGVVRNESSILQSEIISIESDISAVQDQIRASDKDRFTHETTLREYAHQLQLLYRDRDVIADRFERLEQEYRTAEGLVGLSVASLRGSGNYDPDLFNNDHHAQIKLSIDRLKVRLEDMGGGGAGDILQEYKETVERDTYLAQQLQDLEQSIIDLEKIIIELKSALSAEFAKGVTKINTVFEKFFVTMFGGGSAKLHTVTIVPKKRKTDEEIEESLEEDVPTEQGIDIDVNLPRKKVKDLEMLSGGERSLTSIALLFALSQVNPPPFLVLDETDAALDEANSKKYGDMIETLAMETQLIVVTHNRETMSRAGILYGVTLGADDASTLLSIKFEEAVKVAK